jgi:regulator of RNase E activity RraA
VSTATLTTLLFKRGLRNTFVQGARPLNPNAPQMVGPAYTLRYIPAREDIDTLDVFADRTHPQRAAVEAIPPGFSAGDGLPPGRNCRLGRKLSRHPDDGARRGRGRERRRAYGDSPGDREARPSRPTCQGGSAPTNLIKHHAADLNVPIGCGGVPVFPGDICVGDGEGVVIIPPASPKRSPSRRPSRDLFETFVIERVRGGQSTFGLYPPDADSKKAFEDWRAKRKR